MKREEPKSKVISRTAFAKYMQCDPARVNQAIDLGQIGEQHLERNEKTGKLVGIHWKEAELQWLNTYDGTYASKDSPLRKVIHSKLEEINGSPQADFDNGQIIRPLEESKRLEAHYKSELVRMEKEEKEGTLVKKDAVRSQLFSYAVEVRTEFKAVGDRMVDSLLVETDRNRALRLINDEIDKALNKLTEVVERDFGNV